MARRAVLVVNPEAGGGEHPVGKATAILEDAGWSVAERWTEMRGHGVLLAQEAAADGVELVVAVGGDGTTREVAAGIEGTPAVLAIVPNGTGNSSYLELFGRTPWDVVLAAADPAGARAVDLGRVSPGGEVSLLGFSVGWFAQVVKLRETVDVPAGPGRYQAAAQAAMADPIRFTARVEIDGELLVEGELGLVAVGGARVRGSVFPVLPKSTVDDGLLEVLTVDAAGSAAFGELLGAVMTGSHLEHPLVRTGRGRSVRVVSGMPLPAEVDGDLWERETGEATIEVVPGALRVLRVPPGN